MPGTLSDLHIVDRAVMPDWRHAHCQVEELSASAADKKQAKTTQDPLDAYCEDNPEADECRCASVQYALHGALQLYQNCNALLLPCVATS